MNENRPNADPALHGLEGPRARRTLAADLGSVVDEARQLRVDIGMVPYRVFSVVVAWSGGKRGVGTQRLVRETEFLPTPEVRLEGQSRELRPGGARERGRPQLRRISTRYSEDEVRALLHRDLLDGEEGHIEVRMDERLDDKPRRRRFTVAGAPFLDQAKFEWTVKIAEQDDPRQRNGRF
jgi:hypothetical protein